MSGVLPLTTRGRHLPSSWTHLTSLHTPVHPLITSQLVSITVDYLCTSLPSLWLARSPTLVYALVYVVHHLHCVAVCVVPFLNIVLPVGLLFIKKRSLPALGLRSLFSTVSSLSRDNVCNVLCISSLSVQYNDQKYILGFYSTKVGMLWSVLYFYCDWQISSRKKENGNGSILPGLGRDEIFFVGEGRERFENPLVSPSSVWCQVIAALRSLVSSSS